MHCYFFKWMEDYLYLCSHKNQLRSFNRCLADMVMLQKKLSCRQINLKYVSNIVNREKLLEKPMCS
ncbi:Uncharacterized protein APZ42_022656 [Daphnia magna]|uniref:Uncharacterized protein n=1 Tax=Daphnia magna TaxID=35525 RepID=A0A164VP38_9CRUS|nr:Uncharacterized protein APZ42_022656 [Daphnia magna]